MLTICVLAKADEDAGNENMLFGLNHAIQLFFDSGRRPTVFYVWGGEGGGGGGGGPKWPFICHHLPHHFMKDRKATNIDDHEGDVNMTRSVNL